MIRLIAIAALAVLVWLALAALVRFLRGRAIDWAGVAFAVGFVMLAFWLQHVTGGGQLFG